MILIYSNYKKTKGYYNYEEKINIIYVAHRSYQLRRVQYRLFQNSVNHSVMSSIEASVRKAVEGG